jgi:LPS export ABC transporter protein LptC
MRIGAGVLAGVAAASLAACGGPLAGAPQEGGPREAADRGYFATRARIVETAADGRPRYTIDALRIEQDADSRRIVLVRPTLALSTERGQWNVSAATGELPENATRISLAGDVRLSSRVGARLEPIEIRTEALTYEPERGLASGESRVTITVSGQSLSADGFAANLRAQTLSLESEVNGRFTP